MRFRSIFERVYLSVFILFSELAFFLFFFSKSNLPVNHNMTTRKTQDLSKKMKNASKTLLTVISTLSIIG